MCMLKVWITKYALTSGVKEIEGEIVEDTPTMLSVKENGYLVYYHKPHWHVSKEEASSQVLTMILAKEKSLQATMAKLKSLKELYT